MAIGAAVGAIGGGIVSYLQTEQAKDPDNPQLSRIEKHLETIANNSKAAGAFSGKDVPYSSLAVIDAGFRAFA